VEYGKSQVPTNLRISFSSKLVGTIVQVSASVFLVEGTGITESISHPQLAGLAKDVY